MSKISLIDVGIEWFKDIVAAITEWFSEGLDRGYQTITSELFGTPTPKTTDSFVFGTPTNEPWVGIHGALVGGEITAIALLFLFVCIQGRHVINIFNIGSNYEARRTKKTAWTGALLIITWYWIAILSLYLVHALTITLVPSIGTLVGSMLDFLSASVTNPMLGLSLAAVGGLTMWAIQALLFIRRILIYVFVYGMPIGIALAFGNLPVLSRIAKALCARFVPLVVMPIPLAVLFRAYELLFHEGTDAVLAPSRAFLQYLVAVSLPVLGLVVVWKLFRYATPMMSNVAGSAATTVVTVGSILGASSVAGPMAASTAARWGPKAAAGHTLAQRVSGSNRGGGTGTNEQSRRTGGTNQDRVATDAYGQRGIPTYRRTENDPGYY